MRRKRAIVADTHHTPPVFLSMSQICSTCGTSSPTSLISLPVYRTTG